LNSLPVATRQVSSTYGFNLTDDINLLSTPPLVDDSIKTNESLNNVAQFRAANEAFSAMVMEIANSLDEKNGNDVLHVLVKDLSDQQIDGKYTNNNHTEILLNDESFSVFNKTPDTLIIPNTEKSIANVKQIILDELSTTGGSITDNSGNKLVVDNIELNTLEFIPDSDGDGVRDNLGVAQYDKNKSEENPSKFSVGGLVSGLYGQITITLNNDELLTLTEPGQYSFETTLTETSPYEVSFNTSTGSSLQCTLNHSSGIVTSENINNVNIFCHSTYINPTCTDDHGFTEVSRNFNVLSSTPTILGITAETSAAAIRLNETFSVTFLQSFDQKSISNQHVYLVSNQHLRFLSSNISDRSELDSSDNMIIETQLGLSSDNKTLNITPQKSLEPDTCYQLFFDLADNEDKPIKGSLYFYTIRNIRVKREEFDTNGNLDEKFSYIYDTKAKLIETIKWNIAKPNAGYIRKEDKILEVTQNDTTSTLQTDRVEYILMSGPDDPIPTDLDIRSIRLKKEIRLSGGNRVIASIGFDDAGADMIWGTMDDSTQRLIGLSGLTHYTHLLTNYYRGFDSWPSSDIIPVPIEVFEESFEYRQSIVHQYRQSDNQIQLRVDYRKMNGTIDPITGIQGPINNSLGRLSPDNTSEEIDDYRLYIYNSIGQLVLRIDVNPRYGVVDKANFNWKLDGTETYEVNKIDSPMDGLTVSAIDDYRVYQYSARGQLQRYIEYEQDIENGNPVDLNAVEIEAFRNSPGYESNYITNDKIDEEAVYQYNTNSGGLMTRTEYHGPAENKIISDIDTYASKP